MDADQVLDQVRALLQTKGRLAYRLLQLQFQLDDALAALKEELIESEQLAVDKDGKCWCGTGKTGDSEDSGSTQAEEAHFPEPPLPRSSPRPNGANSRCVL